MRMRVLLITRAPSLKGAWSIPGGVVELGETLTEALVREVFEETGLSVEVGAVLEVFDRVQRGSDGRVEYHFVIVDYLCRPTGGTLAGGTDAAAAEWAPVSRLEGYGLSGVVRRVINKASSRAGPHAGPPLPEPPALPPLAALLSAPGEIHRHAEQHDDQSGPRRRGPVDEQHDEDRRGADDVERRHDRIAERAIRTRRRPAASRAAGRCRRSSGCRRSAPPR